MERKIAVEEGLSPIKEYLKKKGYQVVSMRAGRQADAAVVSGMDSNFMNMEDVVMDAPVVNAQGRTPEDVLRELESKWLQ
ncbi:MAG: YkuS family protein [Bacillota bacterium]|nr:YkuS family protein [Bacillota bacterium]MDW7684281.1 YkuS family protein [Bacillota bacterium]